MKRQTIASPGSLSRLFQAAAEAWRCQNYDETIAILEKASKSDPANASVLLDLGRAYGLRYDYASAERCLEKAVRVTPQKLSTLAEAGKRCQEFGNHNLAALYFERAAKEKGASPAIFVSLAELHERTHQYAQANSLVEQALVLAPNHAGAILARARLARLGGGLEEAESQLRHLLSLTGCNAQTRVHAYYELGGILDRQKRFDEAMNAFLEAKSLQRPGAKQSTAILEGVQARVRELEQTISAQVLERWSSANSELGPEQRFAVLCGHPRSGTTLLEQVLDAHPAIVCAEETHILHDEAYLPLSRGFKETTSVQQVLEAAAPSQLRQSRENYFKFTELFIGKQIGAKLLIDKNPALNVLIPAVVRIFPEAKFVVALRDPRDVCLSCFMQALPLNPVSSAYLTLEGTAIQYTSVMGFWRTMLSRMRNGSCEVRYEELVDDPKAVSGRTLEFLGVNWDERVLRFNEHALAKPIRSPSYAEVAKPIFKNAVGRWRNYEKFLGPWMERLAEFIRAYGYD